jgi:hypothetical protein
MSKLNEMPIILIQWNQEPTSRMYYNFNTREEAVDYIFKLYEECLRSEIENNKTTNGSVKIIEMSEIISFLYSLNDFAYLELKNNQDKTVYLPYGKDWFCDILLKTINKTNK